MKAIITFSDSIVEATASQITIFQAMGLAFELQDSKKQTWLKIELFNNENNLIDVVNNKNKQD